jgi:hypothetical protein
MSSHPSNSEDRVRVAMALLAPELGVSGAAT